MAIESLSPREQEIILQCMKAVSKLIDEWELNARLGISSAELGAVIEQWPAIDDSKPDSNASLAINNSLNEISHGLRIEEWCGLIDAMPDEVRRTYRNWLEKAGSCGGVR